MRLHDRRGCRDSECAVCPDMKRAHRRFFRNAQALIAGDEKRTADPALWADAQTSYHDLRAALCFAAGVPVDEVDPCTGHHLSGAA